MLSARTMHTLVIYYFISSDDWNGIIGAALSPMNSNKPVGIKDISFEVDVCDDEVLDYAPLLEYYSNC